VKDGISSYPKHFLLILLSDVTEMVHKIGRTLVSSEMDDNEKILTFEELILSKDAALLYLTINSVIKRVIKDKKELKNIRAELKLHLETHQGAYDEIDTLMAETELEAMIKKVGLFIEDDSEEDDSNSDD
jgi:Xaa-Pro aminopeptidase